VGSKIQSRKIKHRQLIKYTKEEMQVMNKRKWRTKK